MKQIVMMVLLAVSVSGCGTMKQLYSKTRASGFNGKDEDWNAFVGYRKIPKDAIGIRYKMKGMIEQTKRGPGRNCELFNLEMEGGNMDRARIWQGRANGRIGRAQFRGKDPLYRYYEVKAYGNHHPESTQWEIDWSGTNSIDVRIEGASIHAMPTEYYGEPREVWVGGKLPAASFVKYGGTWRDLEIVMPEKEGGE